MKVKDTIETEANLFALFLLMPADLLMAEIEKQGPFDWTDDKALKGLCETFGVTLTALTVRLGYLAKSQKKRIGFA